MSSCRRKSCCKAADPEHESVPARIQDREPRLVGKQKEGLNYALSCCYCCWGQYFAHCRASPAFLKEFETAEATRISMLTMLGALEGQSVSGAGPLHVAPTWG